MRARVLTASARIKQLPNSRGAGEEAAGEGHHVELHLHYSEPTWAQPKKQPSKFDEFTSFCCAA